MSRRLRIASIVGARPEFVQVAVLSRALRQEHDEILIHTGQHYDYRMSDGFFEELGIPAPEINLGIGSMAPSAQTGEMMRALAHALRECEPDVVIVRGDTNSTLAGALVAKQLLLPMVHIEAGMRSYDRTMPEEINRVVADHLADFNLTTDQAAADRLAREGVTSGVHVVGDVMYDIYLQAVDKAQVRLSAELRELTLEPYDLLTIHRTENTDDRVRLAALVGAFAGAPRRVIFPMHPRTKQRLADFSIVLPPSITAIEPLSYLQIIAIEKRATVIFTDSGGVQREAYFSAVPCVTLRDTTEWTNTVEAGWNRLAGVDLASVHRNLIHPPPRPSAHPALFGDGDAARKVAEVLGGPAFMQNVLAAKTTRQARAG